VFIWNMASLNGMKPFGARPNTKTMWAWLKADNIISFRVECYNLEATSRSCFSVSSSSFLFILYYV
jgi:hypothetical protein